MLGRRHLELAALFDIQLLDHAVPDDHRIALRPLAHAEALGVHGQANLAGEVAVDGVTVNLLLPGQIATDRLAGLHTAMAESSAMTPDQVRARALAAIPAGRFGDPAEFGDVAAFLASPRAGFITGCAIKVDGGQTMTL